MPEVFSSTFAWRRRLGFWDDVRWTRRHRSNQLKSKGHLARKWVNRADFFSLPASMEGGGGGHKS